MANLGLLVVNTSSLTATETAIYDRLTTTLSHTVTLLDDGIAPGDAAVTSQDGIVMAPSISVVSGWADCTKSIYSLNEGHGFNLRSGVTGSGAINVFHEIQAETGDPLAAGFSKQQDITMFTNDAGLGQRYVETTTLSANTRWVARPNSGGNGGRCSIMAAEAGALVLNDHTTPARRVVWITRPQHLAVLAADGWAMFDAAAAWITADPASAWQVLDSNGTTWRTCEDLVLDANATTWR